MPVTTETISVIANVFGGNKINELSRSFLTLQQSALNASREALQGFKVPDLNTEGLEKETETAFGRIKASYQDMQSGLARITPTGITNMITDLDGLKANLKFTQKEHEGLTSSIEKMQGALMRVHGGLAETQKQMRESTVAARGMKTSLNGVVEEGRKTNSFMVGFENRGKTAAYTLNVLSAAGAGFMMAMSAAQGNIVGMAFGLIFLKFAMVPVALAAAALTIAINGLVSNVKRAVTEFKAFQDVLFGFNQILGDFRAAAGAAELATKIAVKFGFELGNVQKGIGDLAGAALPGLEELMPAIQDLAAVMGGDYAAASKMVIQAVGYERGNLLALRDAHIKVDEAMAETFNTSDRLSRSLMVGSLITERYGGAAKEFPKTMTGAWNRVTSAIKGFFAALGAPIVQTIIVPLFNKLADFAESLRVLTQQFIVSAEFARYWTKLLGEGRTLLKELGFYSEDAGDKFRTYFINAIINTIRMMTLFVMVARKTVQVIKQIAHALRFLLPFFKAAWDAIRAFVSWLKELLDKLRAFKEDVLNLGGVLKNAFVAVLGRILAPLAKLLDPLFKSLRGAPRAIWDAGWKVGTALGNGIKLGWKAANVQTLVDDLAEFGRALRNLAFGKLSLEHFKRWFSEKIKLPEIKIKMPGSKIKLPEIKMPSRGIRLPEITVAEDIVTRLRASLSRGVTRITATLEAEFFRPLRLAIKGFFKGLFSPEEFDPLLEKNLVQRFKLGMKRAAGELSAFKGPTIRPRIAFAAREVEIQAVLMGERIQRALGGVYDNIVGRISKLKPSTIKDAWNKLFKFEPPTTLKGNFEAWTKVVSEENFANIFERIKLGRVGKLVGNLMEKVFSPAYIKLAIKKFKLAAEKDIFELTFDLMIMLLKIPKALLSITSTLIKLPFKLLFAPTELFKSMDTVGKTLESGLKRTLSEGMLKAVKNVRSLVKGTIGLIILDILGQLVISMLPLKEKIKELLSEAWSYGLMFAFTEGVSLSLLGIKTAAKGFVFGILFAIAEYITGVNAMDVIIDAVVGLFKGSWESAMVLVAIALIAIALLILGGPFTLTAMGVIGAILVAALITGFVLKHKEEIKAAWKKVAKFFVDGFDTVKEWILENWVEILMWVIGAGIAGLIFHFKDDIAGAFEKVKQFFVDSFNGVKDWIIENFTKIMLAIIAGALGVAALGTAIKTTLEFFGSDVYKAIKNGIEDILDKVKDTAKKIVGSLKEGIKAAWGGFKSFVKEKAKDIWKWIRDETGIHSYSIEGIGIGAQMVLSLAKGMQDAEPELTTTAEEISRNVMEALAWSGEITNADIADLAALDIDPFVTLAGQLMDALTEIDATVDTELAGKVAESVSLVLGSISSATESLNAMQTPLGDVDTNMLAENARKLTKAATTLVDNMSVWSEPLTITSELTGGPGIISHNEPLAISEASVDFADNAAQVLANVGQGVQALTDLKDFAAPSIESIQTFAGAVETVITEMAKIQDGMEKKVLTSASEFAGNAEGVFTIVGEAASAITKVKEVGEMDIEPDFAAFSLAITTAITTFKDLAYDPMMWAYGIAVAIEFLNKADAMFDKIDEAATAIGKIGALGEDIQQGFQDLYSGVGAGAYLMAGATLLARDNIGSSWTGLLSALKLDGTDLGAAVGNKVAEGVITGMQNYLMTGTALVGIQNFVDLLRAKVDMALDSHSPSKLFVPVGEQIAAGIVLGINKGASNIRLAVNDIVGTPEPGVGAGLFGENNGGVAQVNITVTDSVVTTEQAMDQLAQRLSERMAERFSTRVVMTNA